MRKIKYIIVFVAMTLLFISGVHAEDELYTADDFGVDSIYNSIPDEVREYLPENSSIFDSDSVISSYSVGYFARVIGKILSAALYPTMRTMSTLLGLIVISSALGALKGIIKSDSLSSVFEFASGLCIMLALFGTISKLFESVQAYLYQLSTLVNTMLPVMTAINIAGGNITASAVSANAMMLGLSFVEMLAAKGLFPVLQLCFGISIASALGGGLKLDGITKLVRGTFSWILGLIAAVISTVMSFQNSIAASADSLSMRAVRFAASNAIPVVGGIAGD
ncbi:MAG: hypothetical protein HFE63_04215, partial [Clostridiales bacterium]|nr:hypothetical protein [Clostridiales bacterium]